MAPCQEASDFADVPLVPDDALPLISRPGFALHRVGTFDSAVVDWQMHGPKAEPAQLAQLAHEVVSTRDFRARFFITLAQIQDLIPAYETCIADNGLKALLRRVLWLHAQFVQHNQLEAWRSGRDLALQSASPNVATFQNLLESDPSLVAVRLWYPAGRRRKHDLESLIFAAIEERCESCMIADRECIAGPNLRCVACVTLKSKCSHGPSACTPLLHL